MYERLRNGAVASNLPVKQKVSEITIEFSMSYLAISVPRTGLEPARLSALAPETSASTIPPPGHRFGFASAKVALFSEMTNFFYAFLADYSTMAI